VPGERVRKMEVKANEAFDVYRDLYYEGGVSSVFLWNLDDGFAGVVLLKKGETPSTLLPRCIRHIYTHSLDKSIVETKADKPPPHPPASPQNDSVSSGVWDSIHVFEASERGRTSNYRLTSTVILSLATKGAALGEVDLSGNMTRQVEQDLPVENDESHIANIGRLVEDMELKMRNLLQEVYFGKAKDVVGDLRSIGSLSDGQRERDTQRELIGSMRR
jgi:capping protein beta